MNNNKILTVSYGTFSCTLEGFDDSFGTMKAIAEYFRDLAADDRYFGAEPPQPDADMLARIAQKEVSRRVQAREQDGKIVLSAIEDQTVASQPAPMPATATAALADPAPSADAKVEVSTAAPAVDMPAPTVTIEESAQDAASVVPVAVDTSSDIAKIAPEEINAPVAEVAETDSAAPEFVEDENDIVPGQPDADVEAFFAESSKEAQLPPEDDELAADLADETQTAPVETVSPASEAPAPDSITAKLQRIRAVVAQHEDDDEEDDDYLEDEHAEEEDTANDLSADDVIADARTEIKDALDADDAVETATSEAPSQAGDEQDDDVSAILSRLESAASGTPVAVAKAESKPLKDVPLADTPAQPSVEDTVSNLFEDEAPLDTAPASSSAKVADDTETANVADATDATSDKTAPRARVIKVKRADLEAALEKGELEEYGDDGDEPEGANNQPEEVTPPKLDDLAPARGKKQTALSDEDAADLARELAELDEENTKAPAAKQAGDRTEAARHSLPAIDDTSETDVNRLLAETDHQMDQPESTIRRDAFAHLRAAVAARKADVAMGDTGDAEDGDGAYREDLAEVVRPRRPTSAAARTERPGDARPAPLKLVAEQRIDVQKPPANTGPVRPRRITAAADDVPPNPNAESFSDFAAEMGATTLPQLLEAAAAYMSFVEGHDQFSRPQLMTKVRQAGGPESFSREEGLRSFGQLLRAGKIEKIKGGRFTVSDDIGYRPDERAVG
ncbi:MULTISPECIES: hypothetical protein [unclassified Sulfitobacter]|nr:MULTISPECIES: hypothetical protein [unclassified Sulfitobacter]